MATLASATAKKEAAGKPATSNPVVAEPAAQHGAPAGLPLFLSHTASSDGIVQRKCAACAGSDPCPKCEEEEQATVQKKASGSSLPAGGIRVGPDNDPLEREADVAAEQIAKGSRVIATGGRSLQRQSAGPGPAEAHPSVDRALRSAGRPLEEAPRRAMEAGFGQDFSGVRIHTGADAAQSAQALNALAYTVGSDVVFGDGRYAPDTGEGSRLLAHELTHVVQQSSGDLALQRDKEHPDSPALPGSKPFNFIDVETFDPNQTLPGCIGSHVIGESWRSFMLLDIELNGSTRLKIFDFETGQPAEYNCVDWEVRAEAASFMRHSTKLESIAKQLTKPQIRALWPDAWNNLLKMYEAGNIVLDDDLVLSTYRGMIKAAALNLLDTNEKQVDEILDAAAKVGWLEGFAADNKAAAEIRDRLNGEIFIETLLISGRLRELTEEYRTLAWYQSDPAVQARMKELDRQRDQLTRHRSDLQHAVEFWEQSFPLLKRLKTDELYPGKISATLREIKQNIDVSRKSLETGRLDVWDLDPIRQAIDSGLGPKTRKAIGAEETSRKHSSWLKTAVMTLGMVALAFIPGGAFLDFAIGLAMAADSWDDAEMIGKAANSGIDPEEGLMSQAQASGARFAAILSTILAAAGPLASGFRALRSARAFAALSDAFPELATGERAALARALAGKPAVVKALAAGAGDEVMLTRLRLALAEAAGNPKALATALTEAGEFGALRKAESEVLKEEAKHIPLKGGHFLSYDKAGNAWICSAFCTNVTAAARQVLSASPRIAKDPEALQLVQNLINSGMADSTIASIIRAGGAQRYGVRNLLLYLGHIQMAEARGVSGVAQVLADLAAGGSKAQGARWVLEYLEITGQWAKVNMFELLETGAAGGRRYDIIINYIRHELKDWSQFYEATFLSQIRRDLEIGSLEHLRWVFSSRLGTRAAIARQAIAALRKEAARDPAFAAAAARAIAVIRKGDLIEVF